MTPEPTTSPINDDDNAPATKRELNSLEHRMDVKLDAVITLIKEESQETRDHFDAVAENIHLDVAGANQDEITLLKDQKIPDHEERIQALEKHAGLPVGSANA